MRRPSIHTPLCPDTLARLLAATAAEDQAAFAELYDLTRRKLFGVALTVLRRRDLAEDVLQEAYIRVWRNAARFDPARGTRDHLDGDDRAQPRDRREALARRRRDR